MLSLVAIELHDGLAQAPPPGACASRAHTLEENLRETWRLDACATEAPGVALSGERQVWGPHGDMGESGGGSSFAYVRKRADGLSWVAEGQTDWSQHPGEHTASSPRALMHGTMSLSGGPADANVQHVYAYHLIVTEGANDRTDTGQWLSGVAQLNFASLEATTQIKLSSLWLQPNCPWPVGGHVSIATTAGDGSFSDATLVFTQTCGIVKDDRGTLTSLTMPWEEGA